MAIIKKSKLKKPEIDLSGQDGNSFALMGYARMYAKQLGFSKEDVSEMISDMMSSDYEHLLSVFESHFGEYVNLIRKK